VSKAFTSEETEDLPPLWRVPAPLHPGQKRHITAAGRRALLHRRDAWEAERVALAAADGWQHAERLKQLAASLDALDRTLAMLTVAELPAPDDPQVRLGSRVTVREGGRSRQLQVVGPDETDGTADKVSMESPLGRALLGARRGDEVDVELPRGDVVLAVLEVEQRWVVAAEDSTT
jgi:transcription elongation GreA/GreB family factor